MAHLGEIGIVDHIVGVEPPAAQHGRYERCDEAADVDEHVENLKTGVALRAISRIIIQLAYDSLQVALEKAVAESYQEKGAAGEGKKPRSIALIGHDGHGEDGVAQSHNDQTGNDSALEIACFISDKATHKAEDVDTGIEKRIDECGLVAAEAEFRAQEEHEDSVHDVITESLAHVAQRGRNKALGVVCKHRI